MDKDPWIHRNATLRCWCCMWFVSKKLEGQVDGQSFGRCRRHAPTMSGYPAVFGTDWCGDHKMDVEKLEAK
jgi:hypothetical protein